MNLSSLQSRADLTTDNTGFFFAYVISRKRRAKIQGDVFLFNGKRHATFQGFFAEKRKTLRSSLSMVLHSALQFFFLHLMFIVWLSPLSAFICQHSSLLSLRYFLMGMNILLDEIPTYYVLDFVQTKASLTIGEEGRKSATRPSTISGQLNLGGTLGFPTCIHIRNFKM